MTYNEMITAALLELGRLGQGQTANAWQGKIGLEVYNGMMAQYFVDNLDFNHFEVPLSDINETAPVPEYAREGLISVLAVKLAPRMRAPVSLELAAKAKTGDAAFATALIHQQLDNADMSHLPQGSGHKHDYQYDIDTDQ